MQATTIADFLSTALRLAIPDAHAADRVQHRKTQAAERCWARPEIDQRLLEDLYRLRIDDRVRALLR